MLTCAVAVKLLAADFRKDFCRVLAVRANLQKGRIHSRLIQLRSESIDRKQISTVGEVFLVLNFLMTLRLEQPKLP